MKKVGEGWRGHIFLEEVDGEKIATKQGKTKTTRPAIRKERDILSFLQKQSIDFVPQLIDTDEDSFSYLRIEGTHFKDVRKQSDEITKQHLAKQLLEKAYILDTVGIVHGELSRPTTNVLVEATGNIRIIDFDRGVFHDYSGKNMRHVAQRLLAQGFISLETTRAIAGKQRDDIYGLLTKHMKKGSSRKFKHLIVFCVLLIADQVSKYLFYDQSWLSSFWLFTPAFNHGVGRSIPIPLLVTIVITLACIGGLTYLYKHEKHHRLPIAILAAGALGNLIDRMLLGGVRDFIDLHIRPIFNFADMYITLGIIRVIRSEWKQSKKRS